MPAECRTTEPDASNQSLVDALRQATSGPERVEVFDEAGLRASMSDQGAWDDGFLGPESERALPAESFDRRDRYLLKVLRRGPLRRTLVARPETLVALDAATASFPHFAAVTAIVRMAVEASAASGGPVRFPPLLLVAAPGVGKTRYARAVSGALGTSVEAIAMNGVSERWVLSGLTSSYTNARVGAFAKGLVDCPTASPLFLLDELDKASGGNGGNGHVADVLLSALEPENARRFVDEFVDFPLRLDFANWVMTANDPDMVPAAVLDRALVLDVPRPTREQALVVLSAIAAAAVSERGRGRVADVDMEVVEAMLEVTPRRARMAMDLAVDSALCAGRDRVSERDVGRALAMVGAGRPSRNNFGFLAR